MLSNVYSEYNWLPWKFDKSPQHLHNDMQIQKKFIEWASKELNIKEMADWYNVTTKVI